MSIDSTLHPKTATKKQLKDFLLARGYRPTRHLWEWPPGTIHFHWYDETDYLSFAGVEATIYTPSEDAHNLGPCDWALYTRTRASGSPADKAFQNETIRKARATFGGNFYNDWGGRNRYSQEPAEFRDAPSRGLYLAYVSVTEHLSAVTYAIPDETAGLAKLAETPKFAALANADPMRVLYNALVPFAVASLEGFLSQTFKILIRYNPRAQSYLGTQDKKVSFDDALAISKGKLTLEDVVVSWYSFQNVASIQKAFSEWLGIDFRAVLRAKPTPGKRKRTLDDELAQLIEARHRVIHSFALDRELRKTDIVAIMQTTGRIIDALVEHLEATLGVVVRDETVVAREQATRSA